MAHSINALRCSFAGRRSSAKALATSVGDAIKSGSIEPGLKGGTLSRSLLFTALQTVLLPAAAGALLAASGGAWHPVIDSGARLRELFSRPPAEYSTAPFFVWNGTMTRADIDRFLKSYHDQNIRSIFIHPRPGLITPYLSEEWYSLARYTADTAAKLGMEVWLYDEDSYPSGFAGGNVPAQMPESYDRGQGLLPHRVKVLAPGDAAKYNVILKRDGEGFRDVTASAEEQIGKQGDYYCYQIVFYPKRAWHGGWSYVDLIHPGVTEKFIDVTMKGYEPILGREGGRRVPGIFSDEPNIHFPQSGSMRWTPDLFAQFRQRCGYDLAVNLPALFEPVGDWRKIRHDYYRVMLDLFIERWSKPWHSYAEKKQISWTGHYWEHEWPSVANGPDNMAMYAWHQVPGIDMLFNQFNDGVNAQFGNVRSVRELASVASQMGRRRTLSETYGGGGWELRFEDMKRLGEWEYALGINFMNQHLSFQTLMGARKHDYPQSFSYHEPWWKHYGVLGEHFARLSLALSTGEQVNRTLILEPTTSAWMYNSFGGKDPRLMELGRSFQALLNELEARQVEYDLGSEDVIRRHGKASGARWIVGRRSYDLVVLGPGTESLESSTVALLESYLAAGGKVLAFADAPGRVDGAVSNRVETLARRYAGRWSRAAAPGDGAAQQMLASAGFEIGWNREAGGKLFHQRRQLSDGQVVFLVNSSLDHPVTGTFTVKASAVTRLDPTTGAISAYPARARGGGAEVEFTLAPGGSLLLLAGSGQDAMASAAAPAEEKPVAPSAPLTVRRMEPNALTIDYCDLELGGKLEKDLYFFVAADKVFRHFGFDGNPWSTAIQYQTAIVDRDHFAPDSGFQATYHFDVADPSAVRAGLKAVVERPSLWKVAINGHPVGARPNEWWLDRSFGVYDIGAHVVAGDNAIQVTASPMSVHAEIEPIYITGDFNVEAQARGWRLTRASKPEAGSWKQMGMPFYSWRVAYSGEYQFRNVPSSAKVRLGQWHGTVAEVLVNGASAGIIGWQPYELEINRLLRPGRNRVEVVVYGSLKNLLGPHHPPINRGLTGPNSFSRAPKQTPPGADYDLEAYGLMKPFDVVVRHN